jgi:hypothetical protein
LSNAGIVFSGASAAPPRCAKMIGRINLSSHDVGGLLAFANNPG